MTNRKSKGHSFYFAISVAVALGILFVLYLLFKDQFLADVSGRATYVTGIFGTAVGLAGAWVAIRIAEIATNAQEQANKFDNPYYQKANAIVTAAKEFVSTFEFLVSSAERTRDYSFAEGRANLVMLSWACNSVSKNLESQLMSSGLYAMLSQIEKFESNRNSVASIVQNLLASIEELSRLEKTTDLTNREVELIMSKYVIAMLNLDYLAQLVKKIPNVENIARLLESDQPYSGEGEASAKITVSEAILSECKMRNEEIIDQIFINLGLSPTEEEKLTNSLTNDIIHSWFERVSICQVTHPRLSRSVPDLTAHKDAVHSLFKKNFPDADEANLIEESKLGSDTDEGAPCLFRAVLIDFGTFRTRDFVNQFCAQLSSKITAEAKAPVLIKTIKDLALHVDEEVVQDVSLVHDLCRLVKNYSRSLVNNTEELAKVEGDPEQAYREEFLKQRISFCTTELISSYEDIERSCNKIGKLVKNPNQLLFVFEINSEHDFFAKMVVSNHLPWGLLHWRFYPYLPSPGFRPSLFFDEGKCYQSAALTSKFPDSICLTPILASGALFAVPNEEYDKASDQSGYAHLFNHCRHAATLDGRL